MLSLERDERLSGTRAQDSVSLAGVEPFLLEDHLRLPNLVSTQIQCATCLGAAGPLVRSSLLILLLQLRLFLLGLGLSRLPR